MTKTLQQVSEPNDPRRCQARLATKGDTQCMNIAVEGQHYCSSHGGNEEDVTRHYNLTKYHLRLQRQANSPRLKDLNEEVGILRMMLEEQLLKAERENDLLLYAAPISDLVTKVERTVLACHKLEDQMGKLLDMNQLFVFVEMVIEIISNNINDPEALERIGNQIQKAIGDISDDGKVV